MATRCCAPRAAWNCRCACWMNRRTRAAQTIEETPGVLDRRNAAQVIDALHEAADAAQRGELAGLVTGPVHKGIVNDAGIPYTGTTELLARRAGVDVVMMLASDTLRICL